jgi:SlyX protein
MDTEHIASRFEKVETKLAYIEDFIQRLQAEVVENNALTERISAEHRAIKEKVLQLSRELEEFPDRKPPHY